MDYFYRTVEAAQKQAQNLSLQVSQSAKGISEQISTHTKSLAEQAASASSSAAEQAGQRWKDLNIQEALQLKNFQSNRPSSAENGTSFPRSMLLGMNAPSSNLGQKSHWVRLLNLLTLAPDCCLW